MNAPHETPDWMQLLAAAINAEGSSITQVAAKLDMSRTAISLVMSGQYPARTDRIAAKVLDLYARHTCPHTGLEITHADCRKTATGAVPTSSPQAMRHWRACQGCAHKPQQGAKS